MLAGFAGLVYFSAWTIAQFAPAKDASISTPSCHCGEATRVQGIRVFSCECGIQQCVISVHEGSGPRPGTSRLECSRI